MGKRVVIAEDEAIIRLDLKEILEAEGYEVVGETGRGDEAVELGRPPTARHRHPRRQDARHRRDRGRPSHPADHRVAVLILTAFSQRNLIEEARDAGVAAYLVKPFQRGELVPAIEVATAPLRGVPGHRGRARPGCPRRCPPTRTSSRPATMVDQAEAVLMDNFGLAEDVAFSFIQRTAMDRRVRMQTVAQEVIDGTLTP